MCSSDLPSGLKDWLLTLGFDKQNLSDTQIENEFQRLTPPEMRDIWRHMMNHVVPAQKKKYIEKVLLLQELKKEQHRRGDNLSLPKNLNTVAALQLYLQHEKTLHQLRTCESSIRDRENKIEELKRTYDRLNEERKNLINKKEMGRHTSTLLRLNTERYKNLTEELVKARECLNHVGSDMWNLTDTNGKLRPTEELMKRLIEEVHKFGVRRQTLNEEELILEQRKLQDTIIMLTKNVVPTALQKEVIKLLENTLLKLVEYLEEKSQETNYHGESEWDLPELKKQCVRIYSDNYDLKIKVEEQEKMIQRKVSELTVNLEKHCKGEDEKIVLKNWLDIELLKCRMKSRHNFLSRMEEIARNEMSAWSNTVFTNDIERKKFFKNTFDVNEQLVGLEKEINFNLRYLSDKSIDLFVNYQQTCKSKIEEFVRAGKSSNCEDLCNRTPDFLKTEIDLLRNLPNCPNSKFLNRNDVSYKNIVEYTRRKNFSLYLEAARQDFFQRVGHLNCSEVALGDMIPKLKFSENEFRSFLKKLLSEAKDNLQSTAEEVETCSKMMKLWTNFSVDDLIPEHMMVEKYTFLQWKERYRTYMRNLPK